VFLAAEEPSKTHHWIWDAPSMYDLVVAAAVVILIVAAVQWYRGRRR
jgi:hypothetical protein